MSSCGGLTTGGSGTLSIEASRMRAQSKHRNQGCCLKIALGTCRYRSAGELRSVRDGRGWTFPS